MCSSQMYTDKYLQICICYSYPYENIAGTELAKNEYRIRSDALKVMYPYKHYCLLQKEEEKKPTYSQKCVS